MTTFHEPPLHSGWYLPAFCSELPEGVSPLAIGSRRLMAVRDGDAAAADAPGAAQRDPGDRGFTAALHQWSASHSLVGALTRPVENAHPDLIVENAFDADHFPVLHNVPRVEGMEARR